MQRFVRNLLERISRSLQIPTEFISLAAKDTSYLLSGKAAQHNVNIIFHHIPEIVVPCLEQPGQNFRFLRASDFLANVVGKWAHKFHLGLPAVLESAAEAGFSIRSPPSTFGVELFNHEPAGRTGAGVCVVDWAMESESGAIRSLVDI